MFILPQIAQITQRNAASCIISQRKTVSSWCSSWRCLRNLRDLRETLGFFFGNRLSMFACYSLADYTEEISCSFFMAPLGAFRDSFSETQANNASE